MQIHGPEIKAANVSEIYITALPSPDIPVLQQAEELFCAVAELLQAKNARILQERVLATPEALEIIPPIRAGAYGGLNDPVKPTWLAVPQGLGAAIAGVQVHAVNEPAEKIGEPGGSRDIGGQAVGRIDEYQVVLQRGGPSGGAGPSGQSDGGQRASENVGANDGGLGGEAQVGNVASESIDGVRFVVHHQGMLGTTAEGLQSE